MSTENKCTWIDVVNSLKDQRLVVEGVLSSNLPPNAQKKEYEDVEAFLKTINLSGVDWKVIFLYQYYLMFTRCSYTKFENLNNRQRKKLALNWFKTYAMDLFGELEDETTPVDNQVYTMVDGVLVPVSKS